MKLSEVSGIESLSDSLFVYLFQQEEQIGFLLEIIRALLPDAAKLILMQEWPDLDAPRKKTLQLPAVSPVPTLPIKGAPEMG